MYDCVRSHYSRLLRCFIGITAAIFQQDSSFKDLKAPVAYPGILFGGGGSTNSVEGHRERGSGGSSPLVRGSGGSCNLVQEISFHIGKFS